VNQSTNDRYYFSNKEGAGRFLSPWDILVFLLIASFLFILSWAASQMTLPYHLGKPTPISLAPEILPSYALRTVLRMFIALMLSLVFTFIFGTWAAKSKRASNIIVPAIDVLQSVPVLSFLSITVVGFIHLFPGSQLGPECASIFAIFTAQAWNMVLGFYQSLKTVPADLIEASRMFQLSAWQRFWKIEVPFSMSSLLWNMMMSMSASWFFVVLSEAISVSGQNIRLPGIGSYIALAIAQMDKMAVLYAIGAMLVVIFLYDQLLFRPLITWSQKFKIEETPEENEYHSWLVTLLRRSRLMQHINTGLMIFADMFIHAKIFNLRKQSTRKPISEKKEKWQDRLWYVILLTIIIALSTHLSRYILSELNIYAIWHVCLLGLVTSLRVIILIVLSSIIWVPVGVYIGRRPGMTQLAQPIIQFLAAFPANLFYPVFVIGIVTYHLNPQIWLTPLMILGTQWYILFNVIAGASRIPRDLYLAADNFELKGWLWWKRLALPGIFPYYVTGAITAAGGAWNASIVAEFVTWGKTTLTATGLGEYIQAATQSGDFPKIALGTTLMCLYVLAFNHFLWRPLYRLAEDKFKLE
jgi:NitT/TauT family transport system permease protein